eukprot:402103-Pyramimonas_sp.AAC.1
MVKGKADTLYSAFHLTYNMLLNLVRSEDVNPEMLMQASYRQFQQDRSIPALEAKAEMLETRRDKVVIKVSECPRGSRGGLEGV